MENVAATLQAMARLYYYCFSLSAAKKVLLCKLQCGIHANNTGRRKWFYGSLPKRGEDKKQVAHVSVYVHGSMSDYYFQHLSFCKCV